MYLFVFHCGADELLSAEPDEFLYNSLQFFPKKKKNKDSTMSTNDPETLCQPYDQFILFGDSITQNSCQRDLNFGFFGALQDG